jgi:kinesin family protein 5
VTQSPGLLPHVATQLSLQYLEVYGERVTDLLTGQEVGLLITATGLTLQGCVAQSFDSLETVLALLAQGEARKNFAATAANTRSSRAHTLLILTLTQTNVWSRTTTTSRLTLVDLAGSERTKQSQVTGRRLAEAVDINSSLAARGGEVHQGAGRGPHPREPFMESRLTVLLRSALGGNSRTTVIVTCSQVSASVLVRGCLQSRSNPALTSECRRR